MACRPNQLTRRAVIAGAVALGLPRNPGTAAAAEAVDLAAAKREGKVTLYTSAPIAAAQKMANAFQQKYGITVELFRSGGAQVLRRFMMEQEAGHAGCDVLVSSDPAAVHRFRATRGSFLPFKPEGFDKVPPGLRDPDGQFVAQRVSLISIYGRTDLFPLSDMPKTWDDLLAPRFKGKMVMTNPAFTSLQLGVVAMLSKLRGWQFFERLYSNDMVLVQGNEQALNLVKSGERPVAAGADSQYANEARMAGHRIANVFPSDGTFAIPATTSVVKTSKNPNAAKLLAEYTLSLEAQQLWPESGIYAARIDVAPPAGSPPIADIKMLPMDYPYIASSPAVKNKFSEIFST